MAAVPARPPVSCTRPWSSATETMVALLDDTVATSSSPSTGRVCPTDRDRRAARGPSVISFGSGATFALWATAPGDVVRALRRADEAVTDGAGARSG